MKITVQEFIKCLDRKEIPNSPPALDWSTSCVRQEAIKRGMWALVYKEWVQILAKWLDSRKVLEVMAGRGWLAKALFEAGVKIIATDDNSWDSKHSKATSVFNVLLCDALEAIESFGTDCDVLIISWPPYASEVVTRCLEAWGSSRPIIYIGEGIGGCNAPDSFWQVWVENPQAPRIPLASWPGLHDAIHIGNYQKKRGEY